MASKKSGYFICYRSIFQDSTFKNLLQASCWIYMISSASHQDKNLRFLDNSIFVRRGEMIMPLRITAKRFAMSYSEMRTFILRLVRKKMISTRVHQLQPTSNHPNRKVTIINLLNYDKYQYVESEQPPHNHLSQQVLNNNTNKQILNTVVKKSSKDDIIYTGDSYGNYKKILKNGKVYYKHAFDDTKPLLENI
jgi:predicted transcriptional regulator